MKNKLIYILLIGFVFFSCKNEDEVYITPEPSFEIITSGSDTANIFEAVEFKITGNGNRMVLYTGDDKHNVDSIGYDPLNNGLYVNSGDLVNYTYINVGIYEVALMASSFEQGGENIEQEIVRKTIVVIDREGLNDVKQIKFSADGGNVFYNREDHLSDIDSIAVPDAKIEETFVGTYDIDEDRNFYAQIYQDKRLNRTQIEEIGKLRLDMVNASQGFNYQIKGIPYLLTETFNKINYYKNEDYQTGLFDTISIRYSPKTFPDLVTERRIYLLETPELYSLTIKDNSDNQIEYLVDSVRQGFFGYVYNPRAFLPDYLNRTKFYSIFTYSPGDWNDLATVKLEFDVKLPGTKVYHNGVELTSGSAQTIDLTSGWARLDLVYENQHFVDLGADSEKVKARSTIDIYAISN